MSCYGLLLMKKNMQFPQKYQAIWEKCKDKLASGRPGDVEHAANIAQFILNYRGKLIFDKDVLVPVAMMHDIGHAAILPEHFKYITGPEKVINGKLVHMLAGAKIAAEILSKCNYEPEKSKEIVDIISIHDYDQLQDIDMKEIYNDNNKKIFHDIDCLDRFNKKRLEKLMVMFNDKKYLQKEINKTLDNFYFDEIKQIAIGKIESELKDFFNP